MFRTILRMLSVVWIVLIAASAVAQDKGFKIKDRYQSLSGGNKWAVIIGINDYLNTDITDLRNAVNDAGTPVSAGLSLYRIRTGKFVKTHKMVLLK